LICGSPTLGARSEGHSAGFASTASSGRTSLTHWSMISVIHGQTVSTLRGLGGEPRIALP